MAGLWLLLFFFEHALQLAAERPTFEISVV